MENPNKIAKEQLNDLVELGINMVPVTLKSLLNTFEDAKRDYNEDINSRYYMNSTLNIFGKRIYMVALYLYEDSNFNYVGHFINANNPNEESYCDLNDKVLLTKLFKNNKYTHERNYIFVNRHYCDLSNDCAIYDTEINKEYQ